MLGDVEKKLYWRFDHELKEKLGLIRIRRLTMKGHSVNNLVSDLGVRKYVLRLEGQNFLKFNFSLLKEIKSKVFVEN